MPEVLILDPFAAREFVESRAANGADKFDEVWEGRIVVPPLPNVEHQEVVFAFSPALHEVVVVSGIGVAFTGVNVSDRAEQWEHNYRGPDVAVFLRTNPAVNHGTHFEGGPDFLVEILSPGEKPYDKFDFYAKVNTREVLIVQRDPWWIELHQLQNGKLVKVGRSELPGSAVLASSVLPLTFRLIPGPSRPKIEVTHAPGGKKWEA